MKKFFGGYTLIELLTNISIIIILSSCVIVINLTNEKRLNLQKSAYQITQDLRELQEKSLGGELNTQCDLFQPRYDNFGISLKTEEDCYYIFVDCNDDKSYNNDGSEIITKISLKKGITIKNLSPGNPLNIIFESPDPIVYINTVKWGYQEGEIILKSQDREKTVRINSAGRIEIE